MHTSMKDNIICKFIQPTNFYHISPDQLKNKYITASNIGHFTRITSVVIFLLKKSSNSLQIPLGIDLKCIDWIRKRICMFRKKDLMITHLSNFINYQSKKHTKRENGTKPDRKNHCPLIIVTDILINVSNTARTDMMQLKLQFFPFIRKMSMQQCV